MTGLKLRIASLAVAMGVLTVTPVQPALAKKSPAKPSPSAKSERPNGHLETNMVFLRLLGHICHVPQYGGEIEYE